MAHDHDLLDAKLGYREFERRRNAVPAAGRLIGQDEIGDVLRTMKISPGSVSKICAGSMRLSEQAITITLGDCPAGKLLPTVALAPVIGGAEPVIIVEQGGEDRHCASYTLVTIPRPRLYDSGAG